MRQATQATLWATLATLAACATAPAPAIPDALRACPPPVAVPLPPPKPRTPDSVARWGNEAELALRLANARLIECDARRAHALELVP